VNTPLSDYRTRFLAGIDAVAPALWNRLVPSQPGGCLVRHEFLRAFESSGCLGRESGWEPAHWTLWSAADELVAALPLYRKWHSYGEYVFDWAWAEAHMRHGLAYYPKWLSAVPFTPVSGPRFLCASPDPQFLKRCLGDLKTQDGSSAHLLFTRLRDPAGTLDAGQAQVEAAQEKCLQQAGFSRRDGIQFHWVNRNFADFDDFLAALSQPKRKKIRAERRKVAELGIHFTVHQADQIDAHLWAFFFACYARTYALRGNPPYLNLEFFQTIHREAPAMCVVFVGHDAQGPCCASLVLRDGHDAFGRYWGALRDYPFVHFEACYYQPIEWAISAKIRVIEGGAQGQHKMARGFDPVATASWHWLRHPAFAEAIDRFLQRESQHLDRVLDELEERSAFRDAAGGSQGNLPG